MLVIAMGSLPCFLVCTVPGFSPRPSHCPLATGDRHPLAGRKARNATSDWLLHLCKPFSSTHNQRDEKCVLSHQMVIEMLCLTTMPRKPPDRRESCPILRLFFTRTTRISGPSEAICKNVCICTLVCVCVCMGLSLQRYLAASIRQMPTFKGGPFKLASVSCLVQLYLARRD
jgi:hypothetical protein